MSKIKHIDHDVSEEVVKYQEYLETIRKEILAEYSRKTGIPKETETQLNYHSNKDPKAKATIKLLKEYKDADT